MKEIYVFGIGKYFREKWESIQSMYQVVGFIDNSVKESKYLGEYNMFVYSPKMLLELPKKPVLCCSIHMVEMWEQLLEIGVSEDRIMFSTNIEPLSEYDEVLFSKGEKLVASGQQLIYFSEDYGEKFIRNTEDYIKLKRLVCNKNNNEIALLNRLKTKPVTRTYGSDRGTPVDRYYIYNFLNLYKEEIAGDVMEVATSKYIDLFGNDSVSKKVIIHVKGWNGAIKANLETGEGLSSNMVDCFICTQTLQYIYDLKAAIGNIYKLLKPGGVALISVPGIKGLSLTDNRNWKEYWSFTMNSMQRLCEEYFARDNVCVTAFGNVKMATAYLYGCCVEEMSKDDFDYVDEQFPFLICARVVK